MDEQPMEFRAQLLKLFDQNLITEQNCDYLIRILEQIDCHSMAVQLKGLSSEILSLIIITFSRISITHS